MLNRLRMISLIKGQVKKLSLLEEYTRWLKNRDDIKFADNQIFLTIEDDVPEEDRLWISGMTLTPTDVACMFLKEKFLKEKGE